jgi:hypothetical protein
VAKTREQIEERYRADMDVAEAYRENDPPRYAQMREVAQDRRYADQQELLAETENRATQSNLAAARTAALAKYPLAKAELVSGSTPEAIEESAKALHTFATEARKQGSDEARGASRATRAQAYAGGVPQSEPQGGPGARRLTNDEEQLAIDAKGRNDALRAQSALPGDKRDGAIVGRSEEEVLRDIRVSGRAATLTMQGMKAKSEGKVFLEGDTPPGLAGEDARG